MKIENIDKLISWIKEDKARHFSMKCWSSRLGDPGLSVSTYEHCNTTFCLGGWIDQHIQREEGATDKKLRRGLPMYHYLKVGSDWLGISESQAETLFLMDDCNEGAKESFDALPDEKRADIAINVLEHLKATGTVSWADFVPDELTEDYD